MYDFEPVGVLRREELSITQQRHKNRNSLDGLENANEEKEPVKGDSNGSSINRLDRWCCCAGVLFSKLIFIRLPPNRAAGRVVRIIGIVALEFNEVKES